MRPAAHVRHDQWLSLRVLRTLAPSWAWGWSGRRATSGATAPWSTPVARIGLPSARRRTSRSELRGAIRWRDSSLHADKSGLAPPTYPCPTRWPAVRRAGAGVLDRGGERGKRSRSRWRRESSCPRPWPRPVAPRQSRCVPRQRRWPVLYEHRRGCPSSIDSGRLREISGPVRHGRDSLLEVTGGRAVIAEELQGQVLAATSADAATLARIRSRSSFPDGGQPPEAVAWPASCRWRPSPASGWWSTTNARVEVRTSGRR